LYHSEKVAIIDGNDLSFVGKATRCAVLSRDSNELRRTDRAQFTFGQVLEWHFLRGTRPGGKLDRPGRSWSAIEFAGATGLSDRTIRYWQKNQSLPPNTETIERVLFGDNGCYSDWRVELRQAHARSREIKSKNAAPTSPKRQKKKVSALRRAFPISNIPIRVPIHFLGRDKTLEAIDFTLRANSERSRTVAVHGLPGIGKTTLAAAYAGLHQQDYRVTWWIRAQTELLMRADLVSLGVRLGWVRADERETPAFETVMERLPHEEDGILLIYDNVMNVSSINGFLPRAGAVRVLITSNFHAWRGVAEPIDIHVWPKEVGADYLVVRTGRHAERDAAKTLSNMLGGLPLAHEQAAAYCDRLGISLAEYLKRFEAKPARLLDDERHAPIDHNEGTTVAKSFTLGIQEAAKLHPAAEPLIVFAALLAPEPIPLFLFEEDREGVLEPLSSALAGGGIDEVIGALLSFALVNRETIVDERDKTITTETVRLHRLVREVASARRDLVAKHDLRVRLLKLLAALYPNDVFDDPKSWPRARRLDEHARELVGSDDVLIKDCERQTSHLLDKLGSYRQGALATFEPARSFFERALAVRKRSFGSNDALTATSMNNLARLLRDQGDFTGARSLSERALAIREEVLGPEHAHTAASLNNLASLLQAQGSLLQVRSLFERALMIREKEFGPNHPKTAASLINVARILRDQAKFKEGRAFAERGLAIREKMLGSDHPRTAAGLNVLGSLLQGEAQFTVAKPLFERALTICQNVLGVEHPYTATSLTNLALLFQATGDASQARLLCERALTIREKILGPNHPATATSLNDLGDLYLDQGELEGAQFLFEKALAICERALGAAHPTTATSLSGLASLRRLGGDTAEAISLFKRALSIRNDALGARHPATEAIRTILEGDFAVNVATPN
jgi:tetratricopeptide (TPR) repeat protein